MDAGGRPHAEKIEALLGLYVEQRLLHGVTLDPEELCREDPQLLEPLEKCIREYEGLDHVLAPSRTLEPGRVLLHYRIAEKLGEGGMGQVYAAQDQKLGRRVALKVLPPEMARDPERLERFQREARAVAALNHPNIVTLFSVEEAEGIHFLTMELVTGTTLDAEIPPAGMALPRILEVAEALADALAAAHEQGIVHRDLKPANVMLGAEGGLKVLDFGLAKLRAPPGGADDDPTLTLQGMVVGTVPYMSPEQARGLPLDACSDLFSLGVILYQMATGRRPFRGRDTAELLSAILRDAPEPIRARRDNLPAELEGLIGRCLEKDPERRSQSALELKSALGALRQRIGTGTAPAPDAAAGRPSRRLFIASASEDLEPYRAAAREVARELGFEPVAAPTDGAVEACGRLVESCEGLLAIVGWRRGAVPGPEQGGDGLRSWTQWQVSCAFRHARPVLVAMAGDRWSEELSERKPESRSLMRDFRGELERLAVVFGPEETGDGEGPSLPGFRAQLTGELKRYLRGARASSAPRPGAGDLGLRAWPSPELPERPYPVLLPYAHPDLLGGRSGELAELRQQLHQPVPIVGLYAPSGTGKSSLLTGGLVPALRAEGLPVACDRHPDEPGLARRLLGDLLTAPGDGWLEVDDADYRAFVDRLLVARRLGGAPVLAVDQFEDVLRRADRRHARAVIGVLLAASLQRQPGLDGPLCRWLLAYRQEFHGEVFGWLADALREARGEGLARVESLPHDLSGPERFCAWPLPPLGMFRSSSPGSTDPLETAAPAFLEAIEKPLALRSEDGSPRYPWRFVPGGAARLAAAFGAARLARPDAALVPELQVVLAQLLEEAGEPAGDGKALIAVPDEPGELIDRALEEHLRRALDAAFPTGRGTEAAAPRTRASGPTPWPSPSGLGRTRALLALRELADVQGRKQEGLPAEVLAGAIGAEGREVLEQLAVPRSRLVVLEEHPEGWRYALSHDRMAEVVVRMVDEEGRYGDLRVDAELLALRRFVVLNTELYLSGEIAQATRVPRAHFRPIEEHADALLWGEDRRRWWAACRKHRHTDRKRAVTWRAIAAACLLLATAGAWSWSERRSERRALFEQIAEGDPEAALTALDRLAVEPGTDREELRSLLRRRASPTDLLERGLAAASAERRSAVVLRAVEIALPLVAETPADPVLIANLVWALDYAPGRDPAYAPQALSLRDRVLAPLRRLRAPPPAPGASDPSWSDIPAGTFTMGSEPPEIPAHTRLMGGPGAWFQALTSRPDTRHRVTVSAFRMLRHEVTHREYRRLIPDHAGADELPVLGLSWPAAYTYAAWLGGRLPTEAEWEYAARAGCRYDYCTREGLEAAIDQVAWTWRNSSCSEPGSRLEPNPWGLFDMYGSWQEWAADWWSETAAVAERDPWGPASGAGRVVLGGACWMSPSYARPAERFGRTPVSGIGAGIRVVAPQAAAASAASAHLQ